MPKTNPIVGNAALLISGSPRLSAAADSISGAVSRVSDQISRKRKELKQWGQDHIKLRDSKIKEDFREFAVAEPTSQETPILDVIRNLHETMPEPVHVPGQPAQPSAAGPNRMELEARSVLSAIEYGYKNRYLASLRTFAEYAKEGGSGAAAKAFVEAFERRSAESQAAIRANIGAMHTAACDHVFTEGEDPSVLGWSQALLTVLSPPSNATVADAMRPAEALPPAVPQKREVQNENLDAINEALAELPTPVQPSYDGQLDDLLRSTERLHAVIKKRDTASMNMDVDAFCETQAELVELRAELGPAAIGAAFAQERARLGRVSPEDLTRLKDNTAKIANLARPRLTGKSEKDGLQPTALGQADSATKIVDEELTAIERLHATIKDMFAARKDLKVDLYIDTLERINDFRDELGSEAIDAAMAQQRKELLPETLSVLTANNRKFEALVESRLAEQNEKGGPASPRRWQQPQRPTKQRPQFVKVENLPKPVASVSVQRGVDFLRMIDGTNIGAFLNTLHDLARATPEELTAFVKSVETALIYEAPQRASIERLNNLVDKVRRKLPKNEAFSGDRGERVEKTWEIWTLLKTKIRSLASRSNDSVPDDDMTAARNGFIQIYQA
jgi:hypothetical protein